MQRPNRYALAGLSLCLGLAFVLRATGQPGATGVAAKDLESLIAQDAKQIQEQLAKPTLDKKGQRKVKAAALMIAFYANELSKGKDKAQAMATLRDLAVRVAEAAGAGKADEAKKLAASIKLDIAADAKAKPGALTPDKVGGFDEVMRQFSGERVGGFALEMQMEELIESKGPFDAEKIALLGNKIAAIGSLAHAYPPEKDEGKKTKKAWGEFAKNMHDAALALVEAGRAKKDAEIGKLASKLSDTCVKCHDVFR